MRGIAARGANRLGPMVVEYQGYIGLRAKRNGRRMQDRPAAAQAKGHTGPWMRGLQSLKAVCAGFSLAFFGIGILRFWYQYNLYNLHATTDYGFQVALTNILRALVIFVLLICAVRRELSPRVRSVLVWGSLVLMTVSGALHALDLAVDSATLEIARYATCGVGLVWGGAMWMDVYARLSPARVLVSLGGGVAFSCALSLVCSFLSPQVMSVVNLFVPTCAVLMYWRSMHVLEEQGRREPVQVNRLYSEHYRGGVKRAVLSFSLFAFVLGIALGFPDGTPRELPPVERTLHQIVLVAIIGYALWWVVWRGGRLWFPAVWCLENALLIVAIALLVSETPGTFEIGTACMLMAESVFYPFSFFIAYDLGRHMRRTSMFMLGVVYGGALFCMGAGRLLSFYAESLPGGVMAMTVVMSVLVVIEMVLALRFTATSGGLPLCADVATDRREILAAAVVPQPALVAEPAWCGDTVPGASSASEVLQDDPAPTAKKPMQLAEPTIGERAQEVFSGAGLTAVELRIIELMAHGRSRVVIARDLGYSENTIRNYTRNIYHKVSVHSKQELLDRLGVE